MGLPRYHQTSTSPSNGPTSPGHTQALNTLPEADASAVASLNLLPQPVWIMRARDGQPEFFNTAWCELTGSTVEEGIEQGWLRWISPEDHDLIRKRWAEGYVNDALADVECRLLCRSGEARWHRFQARPERDASGTVLRWFVGGTDIHDLMTQHLAQQNMLDASVDCIKIIDLDGKLTHMNRSGCQALLGNAHYDGPFGMAWLDLLPPEVRKRGQRALANASRGQSARFPGTSTLPGQKPQQWDNLLTPLMDAHGKVTSILCVSREVTLQRETEHRLRIASETDSLTGLFNRHAFTSTLKRLIGTARHTGRQIGLMLIDLDHFKHVNDTLGHQAGDRLLRVLASRLNACVENTGIVARLGGDEFAIAMGDLESEEQLLEMTRRVLALTSAPISHMGHELSAGMSIGCALFPRDATDLSGLLKCADTALNDLKTGGRGGARLFNARMREAAGRAASQLELARQLVRDQAVHPCYEPRVNLADGTITSFQARLQWQDPSGNLLLSDALSTAFSDYELATGLSRILYDKILADMVHCREAGRRLLPVTFRARVVEFLRDELAEALLERLDAFGISPSLIELEITEQALSERGSALVMRALDKLKAAGVRTMLGNFGTGQSSLIRLGHYPVDDVKIDASLIARLPTDHKFQAIVQAITTLAPSLSLGIVAEGIETEEQRQLLLRLGCTVGQGPLFGKPVLMEGMKERLERA